MRKQTQIILSKLDKKKHRSFEEELCPAVIRDIFRAGSRSRPFFGEITAELGEG